MIQNSSNQIFFNFSYLALKLLGKNMYSSAWNAISELVANGIDAGAKKIYLYIDMSDKEHSVVEILDNGYGMNYNDLASKYVWIGRNKRAEGDITDEEKSKLMGRKGVGKLATLYLSDHFKIITKNNKETSAWSLDIRDVKDEDSPCLMRINSDVLFENFSLFKEFDSGTALILEDVDMRGIGVQTLEGLKAKLADFYLLEEVGSKIFVAVKENNNSKYNYEEVLKNNSFKNFSAIFSTAPSVIEKIESSDGIYMPSSIEKIANKKRKVKVLNSNEFIISGEDFFYDEKGNKTKEKLKYNLSGWIGIHSSIKARDAKRNDENYIKNKAYSPNALRLYVRNKLAVNNLMTYIKSTQTMSNYIEGEISFNLLDNDLLPDISTSNREGYPLEDERVQLLLKILEPILKALYSSRIKLGQDITDEENTFNLEQQAIKEAARRRAELVAQQALAAQKEAEEKAQKLSDENEKFKDRIVFFEKGFKGSGEKYKLGMHLGVNFAKEIRGTVLDLFEYLEDIKDKDSFNSTIMTIDRNAEKIEKMPEYIDDVKFSLNSQFITLDIVDFIKQYLETKNTTKLKCRVNIAGVNLIKKADFGSLIMLVENILSNSRKAEAKELHFDAYKEGTKIILDFYDDSHCGLNKKYWKNPNLIFELAEKTGYQGFGIGCYQIKEIVKELSGNIEAIAIKETESKMKLIQRMTFEDEQI